MTLSGGWRTRRKFVWKFEVFVLTRFLHANRFPPPGSSPRACFARKRCVSLFTGGYFGPTFISRVLSRAARDESRQCCGLGLAHAAVSSARLTAASLPAHVARLFFLVFSRGVARIALFFLLGFECRLPCEGLFLFAQDLGRGRGSLLFLGALALSLGGLARQLGLGTLGGQRFALGLPRLHGRIIGPWLAAKLAQDAFPGFLGCFLPVREARFLESAHNKVVSLSCLG